MRHANGQLSFSATDLSRHVGCSHLTSLRRAVAFGELEPPPLYDDPRADVLRQRGIEHEQRLLDRFAEERRIVETIIPSETPFSHREQHPGFHIYHYGAYETTAVKRLMSRYATREDEVDRLLRGRMFVDLHRVVRQGLRASVESYSIIRWPPSGGVPRGSIARCSPCRGRRAAVRPTPEPG